MKSLFAFALIFLVLVPACRAKDAPQGQQAQFLPPIEVFFSPKGGCTEAVVKELGNAKTSVLVQAYSFTSAPIAKALLAAHKRGVKVQVILDKSQKTEKYSEADFLVNVGIPVQIDAKHAIGMPLDARDETAIVHSHFQGFDNTVGRRCRDGEASCRKNQKLLFAS